MTKRSTEMMYTVRMHITNPAQNLGEKKKKKRKAVQRTKHEFLSPPRFSKLRLRCNLVILESAISIISLYNIYTYEW